MRPQVSNWQSLDDADRAALLARPAVVSDAGVRDSVKTIIANVRQNGDAAIRELTLTYDKADVETLKLGKVEIEAAESALSVAAITAIDVAIANVRKFHEAQIPAPVRVETSPGVICERRSHPIDAVGLYVPAGTAPLPSAAIMLAVPAAIVDCPLRILCTPPRPDGTADPAVVVAATRAGVNTIFKVGGAQAIAAMAYGTASIPKVAKIFGPGNTYVTSAKTEVSADPAGAAIDMPAGPSEVLVLADASANPEFVAADLLSQAEHGVDSQVLLVTPSEQLATATQTAIEQQLKYLGRADIARAAIANSRIIIVESVEDAAKVSNRYAPEHLILQCENARALLPQLRNAGSVFVGAWTPESVGDYCSGTNHVLPTYGYARNYSGLGVDQFLRQMTVQELSRDGLQQLSSTVIELAELEGLDAHAKAVSIRLSKRLGERQ